MVIGIVGFELISLSSVAIIMPPKRSSSKETKKSSTGEVVERALITIPILYDTQLFIKKELDITWHKFKDEFRATDLKVDMEEIHVYINIQRLGFDRVSCKL